MHKCYNNQIRAGLKTQAEIKSVFIWDASTTGGGLAWYATMPAPGSAPFQQLWSTARFFHPRSLRWASPNWTPSTPEVMEVGSVLPSWVTFRVNCSPRVDEQNTEHIPYKVTPVYEVLQIKTLQILSPASPLNTVQLWRISLKSWRWYHQQARGNESCETVGLAFNILLWGRKKPCKYVILRKC